MQSDYYIDQIDIPHKKPRKSKKELFPNKGAGRLSSQKAMEGANRWGCKSETIVR